MGNNIVPFNPLDKKHLGESVGQALLRQQAAPLASVEAFVGAGVYVIYYSGSFDAYCDISKLNKDGSFQVPIYIGKAVPKGARKGGSLNVNSGEVLYKRLKEHSNSIEAAENLEIADFHCRYLATEDIWIPLGETLLIANFNPLWNKLVDGFGNHDPGSGRYNGLRPRWDVLHPGRAWASRCRDRDETADDIAREVVEYLRSNPPSLVTQLVTS